mmetsp:Transcript_98997/g.275566  ORF Transcript_98997/g.275566 Transcript_98997/m.275566 type:complete len:235 (-) Transcript_98997:112-816(-)
MHPSRLHHVRRANSRFLRTQAAACCLKRSRCASPPAARAAREARPARVGVGANGPLDVPLVSCQTLASAQVYVQRWQGITPEGLLGARQTQAATWHRSVARHPTGNPQATLWDTRKLRAKAEVASGCTLRQAGLSCFQLCTHTRLRGHLDLPLLLWASDCHVCWRELPLTALAALFLIAALVVVHVVVDVAVDHALSARLRGRGGTQLVQLLQMQGEVLQRWLLLLWWLLQRLL